MVARWRLERIVRAALPKRTIRGATVRLVAGHIASAATAQSAGTKNGPPLGVADQQQLDLSRAS